MKIRSGLVATLLWTATVAWAQEIPPPQLSPQAAYEQAVRPLNIVRDDTGNWSEAEKNALGVAMLQAQADCSARDPKQYAGEDLLAYLQLCTFGWNWQAVLSGAWLYINAQKRPGADEKVYTIPGLTQAYAYGVKASLSQNDSDEAYFFSDAMLKDVPYTTLVSQATGTTARYIQIIHTNQARALLAKRYLIVLDLLRKRAAAAAPDTNPTSLPLHRLYADGLQWPAMMQFNKNFIPESLVGDLDKALPASLPNDDAILIEQTRQQYKLLGAPLPTLTASAYLADPKFAVPASFGKDFGAASVFYLFPDWCSQCVRKGDDFNTTATRLNQKNVHFYALLAQDGAVPVHPPVAAKTPPGAPRKPKATPAVTVVVGAQKPAVILTGTPTVVVPNATLKQFVATDFPWLIVTDGKGNIRFMQPATDNALEEHSLVDQVVDRVLQQWPVAAPQ